MHVPGKYRISYNELVDNMDYIRLYALVNNSKQKEAEEFKEWLYEKCYRRYVKREHI
jgi:hypothetical protein